MLNAWEHSFSERNLSLSPENALLRLALNSQAIDKFTCPDLTATTILKWRGKIR